MLPVVLGTHPDRSVWLRDSLRSIRSTTRHRRVLVHEPGGFEIAALRSGAARFKRFLYVQDSCEILTQDFWHIIDALTEPAWLFGPPGMYLGVYNSRDLIPVLEQAPTTIDKQTSIHWEGRIRELLPYPTLWPEVTDATGTFEERHGRMNLVLRNELLAKWKGNWGQ